MKHPEDQQYIGLRRAVDVLPLDERDVVYLYFGLSDGQPMQNDQIAAHLNITEDEVDQRLGLAITRLRTLKLLRELA